MNDLSWSEIRQFINLGVAKDFFSVGDTKQDNVKKCNFEAWYECDPTTQDDTVQFILLDFDKDGENTATFVSSEPLLTGGQNPCCCWSNEYRQYYGGNRIYHPSLITRLSQVKDIMFSEDLLACVKTVTKTTQDTTSGDSSDSPSLHIVTTSNTIFPLSASELGFNYGESPSSYAYFSTNENRNLYGGNYDTRTSQRVSNGYGYNYGIMGITSSGTIFQNVHDYGQLDVKMPIAFVIG